MIYTQNYNSIIPPIHTPDIDKMSTTEEKPTGEYRQYLPDVGIPRFATMKTQDAHEYAHAFKTKHIPPWLYALFEHWRDLYEEPYQGISTDGMPDYRS